MTWMPQVISNPAQMQCLAVRIIFSFNKESRPQKIKVSYSLINWAGTLTNLGVVEFRKFAVDSRLAIPVRNAGYCVVQV
jgi:hypothetical protein